MLLINNYLHGPRQLMIDFPSPIPTAAPLCTQSYKSRKIDVEVYFFNYKNNMSP